MVFEETPTFDPQIYVVLVCVFLYKMKGVRFPVVDGPTAETEPKDL